MTGERIKKSTVKGMQKCITTVLVAFVLGALLICAVPVAVAAEQTDMGPSVENIENQQPTDGELQLTDSEQQPTDVEQQPTEDEEQPTEDEEQPTEGEEQPTEDEQQPTEEEKASTDTQTNTKMTRSAAPPNEEPAAPEPSIPEDQVEVEAYAIPAGSAYIHEISKEYQYTNTADSNAITDALTGALTYLRDLYVEENNNGSQGGTTERVATIVVQDGTYQGGISMTQGDGTTLIEQLILDILGLQSASTSSDASDMTIRIVAHDAIVEDENGNITDIHAGSEGNVKVEGAIDIDLQELNILLAGLYLSTRDMVNIENADSAAYFGTRQDDVVNLTVSNISDHVTVDTGEGNDTVNADIKKKANVEAAVTIDETLIQDFSNLVAIMLPGSGATGQEMVDSLKPVVTDLYNTLVHGLNASTDDISTLKVDIDLGGGEDSASIKLIDSSDIVASLMGTPDPDTGLNLYQYGFAVDMTAAQMNVNGGSGDDRINISGGRSFTFAHNLMQALIDLVNSQLADKNTLPETKITVTGGLGDDVLTVDTTAAFATWGGTSIFTDGQAGFDRLHLTGKLNDKIDADERIYLNAEGTELTIEALAQITLLGDLTNNILSFDFTEQLKLFMNAMDALTDALLNKRTIYADDIQPGDVAQSFTNYIVSTETAEKTIQKTNDEGKIEETDVTYQKVDFSLEDAGLVIPGGGVVLSNILVSDDLSQPISGRVGLDRLIADGLNVLVMADIIDVSGDVSAKNLILYAYGEDAALTAIETQLVEDDLNESGDLNIELGLYNADRKLQINIDKNARIRAQQAVDMAVQLILNKAFIPGADYIEALAGKDFNPVTLKFGQAEISIFGSIQAGGYIHARTDVDVTIDATNELIKVVVPVALAVSSGHSRVIVGGDAVLLSGYHGEEAERKDAGILLVASSSNDLVAYAHGGSVKFSIALGVVEFETVAQITGNASVNAGGAVKLLASSIVESTSYATGKPSIVWNVSPQSGVFIAGNFIFNETRAIIDGNADVIANQGDVVVDAFADSKASTVSMAIPFNNSSATEQLTPFNMIPFVEKLIGIRPAGNQTIKGKLLAAVTGSNSLGNLFTDATKSAAPDTTFVQVMGALGTAYVKNDNLAKIETTGTVSTPGALYVHATGTTVSDLRADGSLYRTPSILEGVLGNIFEGGPYASLETVPTHAIGAAIAVHVYIHNNEALIAKGTIQASDLSVVADTLDADSALVVKAGHTPDEAQTKLGIGGAIAVHVANVYNNAKIQNAATYQIDGGDVEVIAKGHGSYITVADASGKRSRLTIPVGPISIPLRPAFQMTSSSAGVGAGIAVEVINLDTMAQIEDGVSFGKNRLNSLNVNASYDADFYIEAAAGATGGTSIAPVVALTVSGVNTKATVGRLDGVVTEMPGTVSVTANTSAVREMIADAKAVGSRAGAGAAVGLSIVDDSAVAELFRSVNAGSVDVSADSISRIQQTIYASAQGATPNPVANTIATTEVTIKQFLALFTGQGLSGATVTNSMNPGSADNLTNKNAAALSGLAGRLGGYSGKNGTLNMERVAALAEKRPKMQTTEGSVQVAATIAANIQRNKAQATIADGLSIVSQGDVQVTALEDTDAVIYADSTASNSTTGVGVAAAVNYVEYENTAYVGAKTIKADNLIVRADILEAENLRSVQTILAELINYLADVNGIELLIGPLLEKKGVNSIEELIDREEFDRLFQQYIDQINEGREGKDKLTQAEINRLRSEQQEIIEKMVIDMLVASLQSNTLETASTLMVDIVDSIVDEFFDILSDPEFLLSNVLGTGAAKEKFDRFIAEKGMMASITFDMLREAVVTELTSRYGNPSELENMGNRITTSAVSGAGAANVGIAGSLALSLVEGKAQAIIADLASAADGTIEADGVLELYAQSANKIYTTASSSAANNGLPEKNKNGKADSTGKSVGVGASFAMAKVNAAADALIGTNRVINSAALNMQAIVHNDIDTVSVAGQDPIGRQQSFHDYTTPSLGQPYVPLNQTTSKDIAVDASAALNIIDNTVNAKVGEGSRLYLDGGNLVETARVISKTDEGEEVYELANLYLLARQRGQTYATASGFATGGTAAVGASVAINLANSDVNAVLNGEGDIAGDVIVDAQTVNEDEAQAFALTYGTSLDRYFEKLRTLMSIANFLDNPDTGIVNALVVNKLNQYSASLLAPLQGNLIKSPLMTMALSALGIQVPIPSAGIGNSTASGALSGTGAVAQEVSSNQETSVNIAAAVGVNVTAHKANAQINGDFTADSFDADAQTLANYRAYATGATMLANPLPNINASAISMGVAVSVNENAATASLGGSLTARNDGDIRVNSTITQNLEGKYAGLLAAQSLAGAVGGSGAGVGLAGAVSVVKAKAGSTARILDGAKIDGGNIVVNAVDKSKLAIRAGGLSAGGQTVGLGAAFGMIYDQNAILARVGDNVTVTGKSLDVTAERLPVTAADYEFPFDLTNLFTVSNGSQDDVSPDQKGLIHLNITDGSNPNDQKNDNSIEVNLSTEKVLSVIDMLNYLASVNYYIEAISGSISAGPDAKAALTGGFAVLYAESSTAAEIGDHTTVDLTGGTANVEAKTDINTRVIGGSLAATGATGVGVNAAGFYDSSSVNASVGNGSRVTASGDASVHAKAKNDVLAVTVAAALSTGAGGGASVGGTIDAIVTENDVTASVGKDSTLESTEGSVSIDAERVSDFILVSASASGAGQGVAAGGTLAVIISGGDTTALVGENAAITAAKDISIRTANQENLINVLASASGAAGSASAAGTIGVLVTQTNALTAIGSGANVTSRNGSVQLLSDSDVKQIAVQAALTGSTGTVAAGATVNVGVFEQTAKVTVDNEAQITANGGSVSMFATGRNQTILVNVAGSAASGTSVSGVIPVVISQSTVETVLGNDVTVQAEDTIAIAADLNAGLYDVAGAITVSTGPAAAGATVSTIVADNTVQSMIGDNVKLIAHAVQDAANSGGVKLPNRSTKRRGVIVSANANVQILMVSVSGALSNTSVNGVVNTLVLKNVVKATVGNDGTIEAGFETEDSETESGDDAEAAIESSDESQIFNLAGGVSIASNAGVGATVVSMVYDKTMEASVGTGGSIRTTGNVTASANSNDELYLLALSFAGGGSAAVGVGANALVFENDVAAALGGSVYAGGNVTVSADSDTDMINAAAALAGSGTAAVTPVAVVTWFDGTTDAQLLTGASVKAHGDVTVNADSREFITSDALGVSVSGVTSVSGTVDIIISDQTTSAQAKENVSIGAANIAIAALDNVQVLGVVGTVAASGTAAVGVTAMVGVLHNTVTSGFLGGTDPENNIVKASGSVSVTADAIRDIRSYAASVAAGGGAGVGATIMVNVVGGKLTQDASDSLLISGERLSQAEYNALSKEEREAYDSGTRGGFDPEGFLNSVYESDSEYRMHGLGEKLAGDGVKQSDIQLGDDNGGFDAESGYISEDFHDEDYVDVDENGKEADSARGEDFGIKEDQNKDITEAGSLSGPKYDTASAVTAIIGSGVQVTAGESISVLSEDLVNSDMIAATVGAGGYAGVGAGIAVNVLYSNVVAGVDDNAVLNAGTDIIIKATSGTETVQEGSNEEEAERNDQISGLIKEERFKTNSNGTYTNEKTSSNKLDISSRTIRSIAVTGAGGIAGVSVSGSVIVLNNKTIAYLEGNIIGADNLTVCAESKYPQILTVTGTASGGIAAVGASFAVVYHEGAVEASIRGNAQISGVENAITVNTVTETDTKAAAAAVAGGAVGVNAGVAAAINRMQIDTYIGSGVSITGDLLKKLDVNNQSDTTADAWLMSVAGGGVAAGISGAVTIVAPTVYTYIGVHPDAQSTAVSSGSINAQNAKITVRNTVSSAAKPLILSVGAGGVAVTGSVLLSFNHTNAAAAILRKNIVASSIDVDAYMDARAESIYAGAAVGSVAVGFSVAYVHQRAANRALLDVTGVSVGANSVGIYAGRSNDFNDAHAKATSVSANVGAAAVSINAAIADNQSSNIARIIGAPSNTVNLNVTGPVHVQANGNATAISEVTGLNLGSVSVAASAAAAVLRSTQEAVVEGGNLHAGSMRVMSVLNPNTTDTARAELLTGGGGLISAQTNVAVAYGRSKSIAGIGADTLQAVGDALEVLSTGNAGTTAKITNQNFGYISAGVMSGYAYSQGMFDAYLLLGSGSTVTADSVSVEITGVNTRAEADVTPSAAGVDASYMDIDVNLAIASAKAVMRARIGGINNAGGIIRANNVSVNAQSNSYTDAYIRTPVFKVSAAEVAANTVVSLLDSRQDASIGDVTIETNGDVTVQSQLNTGLATTAKAELGNSGKPGGSVSLVSARVNVAVARANGRSTAELKKASVAGDTQKEPSTTGANVITVSSTGRTVAKAYVPTENASVNLAGIGINVLYASADGGFDAIADVAGAVIQAAQMDILSEYTARAEAAGRAPTGGVGLNVSLVSVKTNVAEAKVGSNSKTGVQGKGTIELSGDLLVKAVGTVDADASFPGTTVSADAVGIAVNVVNAAVNAVQEAYANDASIVGQNMSVLSILNGADKVMADASVGSNGTKDKVSISLVSDDTSCAQADAAATVKAKLSKASTNLSGDLLVQVQAVSTAKAGISTGTALGLFNVSVLRTDANAEGTFEAGIDTTDSKLIANSISVLDNYSVKAESEVTATGGLASVVSTAFNDARSIANVNASANLKGSGTVQANALTVKAVAASVEAIANAKTPSVSLTGLKVALNRATAKLGRDGEAAAVQQAFIENNGSIQIEGDVIVSSTINKAKAEANVGASGTGVGISFVSGDTNIAESTSQIVNKASIRGKQSAQLGAEDVTVLAEILRSDSLANSKASFGVSVATMGNLEADARTAEIIEATITGTVVKATGNINIHAKGNTFATAKGEAPGSAAILSITKSNVYSSVGSSGKRQHVKSYIGDNATVIADSDGDYRGNVDVLAKNLGYAESIMNKKTDVNLGSINESSIPTNSYYQTEASTGSGAVVMGENIMIATEDVMSAKSHISSKNVSLGFHANYMMGKNSIDAINHINIWGTALTAANDLTVKTNSKADMSAETLADSKGGFINEGVLQAINNLVRDVYIRIHDGSLLEADFGDILVEASAGKQDDIYTKADANNVGFTAIGDAKATAKAVTDLTVDIYRGVELKNTFGRIDILATGSMGYLYTYGRVYNAGVGNEPDAKSDQTLILDSNVNIGKSGNSGIVQITGRHVNIQSVLDKLYAYSYAYARGRGLGVNVDTTAVTYATLINAVNADNARIIGHDSLKISADNDPANGGDNLVSEGYSYAQGIGRAEARARLYNSNGSSAATVNLGANMDLIGTGILVQAQKYAGNNTTWAHTKRTGIASAGDYRTNEFTARSSASVDGGVVFHIGDAAAGIFIDISDRADVRAVGIPNEAIGKYITTGNDSVVIQPLSNALAGTLQIKGDLNGNTIYNQSILGQLQITNRTGKNVVFGGVTLENRNFIGPQIKANNNKYTVKNSDYTAPPIRITNHQDGDLTINGLVAGQDSQVTFAWIGEKTGSLYSVDLQVSGTLHYAHPDILLEETVAIAPVFAKILTISGTENIGNADSHFHAYIFGGEVGMSARDSIYVKLTPVELHLKDALPESCSEEPPVLNLGRIEAVNMTDVVVGKGLCFYKLSNTDVISVPVPGTMMFLTTDKIHLTETVTLDRQALEQYLSSHDYLTDTYTYLLPNGSSIITDAEGRVITVQEMRSDTEMITVTLSDYSYDGTYVKLAEGVSLNLTDGSITIEAGYTYSTLLSAVSGSWLVEEMESGRIKIVYEDENALGQITDEEEDVPAVLVSGLEQGPTIDGKTYYWFKGYSPDTVDFSSYATLYYLILDSATDTLELCSFNYQSDSVAAEDVINGSTVSQIQSINLADLSLTLNVSGLSSMDNASTLFQQSGVTYLGSEDGRHTYLYNAIVFQLKVMTSTRTESFGENGGMATRNTYKVDYNYSDLVNGNLCDADISEMVTGQDADGNDQWSVVLGITASANEELDENQKPVGTTANSAALSVTGSTYGQLSLKLKAEAIPGQTVSGYRITDQIYVTSDGNVVIIQNSYTALYDIINSTFTSNFIVISGTDDMNGASFRLSLLEGQSIYREKLTENVAVDVAGNYYYKLDGSNEWNAAVNTNGTITGGGQTLLKITEENGVTYYEICYGAGKGLKAGSDGSVGTAGASAQTATQAIFHGDSASAVMDELIGKTVNLTLEGEGGILDSGDQNTVDITADQAQIVSDKATIGTENNPITIKPYTEGAVPELVFSTATTRMELNSDVVVSVEGDGNIGQELAEELTIDGGSLDYTATGDVSFGKFLLTNGAQLKLKAGGNVTGEELRAYIDLFGDTLAQIQAAGDISIGTISLDDNETSLDAGGSITSEKLTIKGSEVKLNAGGDYRIDGDVIIESDSTVTDQVDGDHKVEGNVSVSDSTVDREIGGNYEVSSDITATDSTVTDQVGGDHKVEGNISASNSTVNREIGGNYEVSGDFTATDSTVTDQVDGDYEIGGDVSVSNSTVNREIGGNYEVSGDFTATDSTVTDQVDGDYEIGGSVSVSDSTVNGEIGGSLKFRKTFSADEADLTYEVQDDVDFAQIITLDDTELSLYGNGGLSMENVQLTNSKFDADVLKDIEFAIIEARETDLTLQTREGSIRTTVPDGYIRFVSDTGNALILSAGVDLLDKMTAADIRGNIGTADRVIIIDSDVPLQIPAVNNYYIDSVELVNEELFMGKRPEVNLGSGVDENGQTQTGDYISTAGPDETVYVALKTQLGEDIAAVLTNRMDRAEWSAMIDEAVVLALIKAKSITAEQMEQLLGQTDNSLVLADIEALLEQGDEIAQSETVSGYEKLAQLLLAELDSKNADGEAVFGDDLLEVWLAEGITLSQVNIDTLADVLTDTMTAEEVEQLIQDAYAKADYESQKSTMPEDPEPRGIEILVGKATGGAYVENEGDIIITQQAGTLTAGAVLSDRGDVTLTAENGGIEGTADEEVNIRAKEINLSAKLGVGENTPVRVDLRDNRLTLVANVTKPTEDGAGGYSDVNVDALDKDGVPTTQTESETRPEKLFALETLLHFDWLRVEYPSDAMQLNATAGGDVNIQEVTGDMGLGVISSENGDITLTSDGDVTDTRDAGETKENIIAKAEDADVAINAENGRVGSSGKPVQTNVGGIITAITEGDVNITDTDALDLIVQIEDGQVNASAEEDINVSNISGDLTVGPIQAGGDADITSEGSIIAGDRLGREAQVEAENIRLTAKDGHIGKPEDPFLVDTDAQKGGKLSAEGDYLNIRELDGDLLLKKIRSSTDAEISAPGSILDGNDSTVTEAVQAQKDANKAQAEADEAEAKAQVQEEEAARAEQALKEAEEALEEAVANTEASIQSRIDKAEEELQKLTPGTEAYGEKLHKIEALKEQLEEAKRDSKARMEALEEARKQYQQALDEHHIQQKEADDARAEADAAAAEAKRLQDLADAAKETAAAEDPTVTTGGDLTLEAGKSIGTEDTGLTVEAGGTVSADAEEGIHLDGHGDLDLGDMKAGKDIRVNTVDGDITGGVLEGKTVDVNALDGDIGTREDPLTTNTDQIDAHGDNVYIHNRKDTTIGNITAEDELVLNSDGDVTGTGVEPNVSADDATINTDGDIGSENKPLDTNVDAFHADAEDIYLDNHSPDLEISDVNADSLDVKTDGNVTGDNNTLHDITINADGFVGRPDDPFEFWADGSVSIQGNLGCWWRNLYIRRDLTALLVLRFEVTVAGKNMTVYALIGVTENGQLRLVGVFLCEGVADEAFWLSVFTDLREKLHIKMIGMVIHDGEQMLEVPALQVFEETKIVDLEEYSEEEMKQLLGQIAEDPDALAEQLDIFRAQVEAQFEVPFETEQEVHTVLQNLADQLM